MKMIVSVIFLLLSIWAMPILAEDLQRLLTTSQQRAQIDHERWQAKQPITQKTDDGAKAESQRQLFFEALLKTEKGYSVWLNGRMYDKKHNLQGVVIDPSQVNAGQLILQTPKGNRRLALGQVYWIDHDKVLEPYEKP